MSYRRPILQVKSQRQHLECLTCWGDKEPDCCSVVQGPLFRWKSFENQAPSLEKEFRGTESILLRSSGTFHSVMIWGSTSSAGVGPLGFIKSTQPLWRCWFHFPAGLGSCPHCQKYQKLIQWTYGVTELDWKYLNPKENLWSVVKRKMRDPTMQMT